MLNSTSISPEPDSLSYSVVIEKPFELKVEDDYGKPIEDMYTLDGKITFDFINFSNGDVGWVYADYYKKKIKIGRIKIYK